MGSYEDEYKKYYSEAKAKMNIKENDDVFLKEDKLGEIEEENRRYDTDIYPKRNYLNEDEGKYSRGESDDRYLSENRDIFSREQPRGTYRGIGSYNISNGNKGADLYSGRNYYGYSGGREFNNSIEHKNMLGKLANKFIFQLTGTFILFACVITIKSLPNEQTKQVYAVCKAAIDKNFDYKEFIDDVKTVNIMDEVNKLKVNLKIDDAIKTGGEKNKENEPAVEKTSDGVDQSNTNESDKTIDNTNQEKTN